MKNTESRLSPEESLALIHKTIEIAQRKVRENGFHFLLWGCLVVVAGLVDFYQTWQYGPEHGNYAWACMPVIGVPVALLYEMRRERRQQEKSTVHGWYGLVWLAFFISMAIVIGYATVLEASPTPLIMTLAGFAVFVSGVILQFRPLVWGSALIWGGAVAAILAGTQWHSLVMALSVGLGYLIPGLMLQKAQKS
jgi:hypothetical protein